MFEESYKFRKANNDSPFDKYPLLIQNFVFDADGTAYIAQVEEYPEDVHIIKFFRKQDRNSAKRFHILTGEFKCTKIVATCMQILISVLEKRPQASFGFLGATSVMNGIEENKQNTKRFRVYKQAMENKIGEEVFSHSMDEVNSTYLMVNKKIPDIQAFVERARHLFEEIYPALEC